MMNFFTRFATRVLIGILVLSFCVNNTNGQGWLWSGFGSGPQTSIAQAIATDRFGNQFVAGSFIGDTIIIGTYTFGNAGDQNIFLVKYSPSGVVLWARRYGGMFTDGATALATDSSGNVYIAGYFTSAELKFDTALIGNYFQNFVEGGESTADGFVAKIDSSGHGIWVKDIGGIGSEMVNTIKVSPAGDIVAGGSFNSDTLVVAGDTLRSKGGYDLFVIRYDAAGNILWHTSAGGTLADGAFSLAVDADDNIYVAGDFASPSVSFGSATLTNNDSVNHVFLVKYSSSGVVQWATAAGAEKDALATSVVLDLAGYPYLSGTFSSAAIGFGVDTLHNSTSFGNMFLVKYNLAGDLLWLKGAATADNVYPQSLSIDSSGYVYCGGYFSSNKATLGSYTISNSGLSGYADIYVAKYDNAGNVLWVATAGGPDDDVCYGTAVDLSGNVFLAGYFASPACYFGLIADSSSQGTDFCAARFNETRMAVTPVNNQTTVFTVWPNPAGDHIFCRTSGSEINQILILDATGLVVANVPVSGTETEVNTRLLVPGVYTVVAQNASGARQFTKLVVF